MLLVADKAYGTSSRYSFLMFRKSILNLVSYCFASLLKLEFDKGIRLPTFGKILIVPAERTECQIHIIYASKKKKVCETSLNK